MALTRRQVLAGFGAAALLTACGANRSGAGSTAYRELHRLGKGANTILVCMPDTAQTREVWRGLSDELGPDFHLVALKVEGKGGKDVIAQAIGRHKPSAVVLMNNPTLSAYHAYLRTVPHQPRLPAVVVMTSFLDRGELQPLGAVGIAYEVPLITVVTNLRKLVASPIERIGVVYRAPLASFVDRELELARRERVGVVRRTVRADANVSDIKQALREVKQHADAVWILNDDRLLTPNLIAGGWLPGLNERPWCPTIVGAASLVSAPQSFGTFAVLPDHTAVGVQTAEMVLDIADNDWRLPEQAEAQLPLSTTTTVDLRQATERFSLRSEALAHVDRIVE
jgi:ABC-type uncharacterized transport system substrate-binding protein